MVPWLAVIGIGEDGVTGLNAAMLQRLKDATIIYGGKRHFDLIANNFKGEKRIWPKPLLTVLDEIEALRGQKVAILASGDPMFFGIGSTLLRRFDADEIEIYPNLSSLTLAASRLKWPVQEIENISLLVKPPHAIKLHLQKGKKLLCLLPHGEIVPEIVVILQEMAFENSHLTILEHLGGEKERIRSFGARDEIPDDIGNLALLAIDCDGTIPKAYPLGTILPDNAFKNDGQLTKHNIRAIVLSHLAPCYRGILWDIGAGCGSISLEWLRASSGHAVAIEKNQKRAKNIQKNAEDLGIEGLELHIGDAKEVITGLHDAPDAIFIGGGFGDGEMAEQCWAALKPGGRLVANAVTLETEAAFHHFIKLHGGELIKVALSMASPLGAFHVWRQALAVTILVATKAN